MLALDEFYLTQTGKDSAGKYKSERVKSQEDTLLAHLILPGCCEF